MRVIPTGLFAFGVLHGYLPQEKRSREDFWKAFGIGTTGIFLYSLSTINNTRYSFIGPIFGSPLVSGLCICSGMMVGKAAAAASKHSEDS